MEMVKWDCIPRFHFFLKKRKGSLKIQGKKCRYFHFFLSTYVTVYDKKILYIKFCSLKKQNLENLVCLRKDGTTISKVDRIGKICCYVIMFSGSCIIFCPSNDRYLSSKISWHVAGCHAGQF